MDRVILFDVNETMLDMKVLEPEFVGAFGKAEARQLWFLTLQELVMTTVITGKYVDFPTLARAALRMTAAQQGTLVAESQVDSILNSMGHLPAYPEAGQALRILRQAGYRLAALTNGVLASARTQLSSAGLAESFEAIFSADEVRRLKPAREAYAMAARRMGVPLAQTRMVAAHAWDIAGAEAAGCATAFVARPGKALNPTGTLPEVVGKDLMEVAQSILAKEQTI